MVRARKVVSDAFPPGYLSGLLSLIPDQSFQILPLLSTADPGRLLSERETTGHAVL